MIHKSCFKSDGQDVIIGIDTKSRTVEGYFSVFGNIDSDGDMIMPGAYTKTLKENSHRVKHLWQHDLRYPLAKPELKEDSYGLRFKSTISDTSYGRDVVKLYSDGVIDEHSVGIQPIKRQKRSGYTEITENRLWEGSTTTWGANQFAIGGMSKSMTKEDIVKKMEAIYKALRNGTYENEELFEALDIYHEQLKQIILDLTADTPAADEAPEPEDTKASDNEHIEVKLYSLTDLFKK